MKFIHEIYIYTFPITYLSGIEDFHNMLIVRVWCGDKIMIFETKTNTNNDSFIII